MKVFVTLISLVLLSSCGFRPVYNGNYGNITQNNPLAYIEVEPLNSIEGAGFYHHLSNILPTPTTPKYLLKVQFTTSNAPMAIQTNSDVLWQSINQSVCYQLLDKATSKQLTHACFRNISSYNTTFSPYASYIEGQDTLENLTRNAAEEVFNRLTLYFGTQKL